MTARVVAVHAASVHLVRYPRHRVVGAVLDVPRLHAELRRAPGLRFWRVLGSGRGDTMTLGADLARWAVLAVWADDAALARFLAEGAAARRWERRAEEAWHARLTLLDARGSWGGVRLVAGRAGERPAGPVHPAGASAPAPIAVLTRAAIRVRHLRRFYGAVGPVDATVAAAVGRLRSAGLGEWPVARQATLSLWRDPAAMRAFAYGSAEHMAVVRRTRAEGWYAEELFARFAVATIAGTWDGADPLG